MDRDAHRTRWPSTHHGRDQIDYVRIGAKRDGTVTGIHAKIIQDCGSYHLIEGPVIPTFSACVIAGCYKFAAVQTDIVGVFTNKFTTDAIRGAGRPEATHMIELTMDALADELGMDRLELRRKNFITEFPYELPARLHLRLRQLRRDARPLPREARPRRVPARAGGAARRAASTAASASRPTSRSAASGRRARSGPKGWGMQGGYFESAQVRVHPTGSVTVYSGASPHGQGLETSFAQIVADRLGVDPEVVDVIHGDTNTGPFGKNTYGSRSLAVGGEAIARAAEKVQDKAKRIVAHQLEAAPEDIELADGTFRVAGSPDKGMTLAEVAGEAYIPQDLPEGMEAGLDEISFYDPSNFVWPFGAHACVTEVDVETGRVDVVRYIAVDDCGPAINPLLIDGQIHGGIVHALGQVLYEQVVYDEDGQLVTGTFVDYALPERRRRAELRDRPHGDAVADQHARRQGRRRGGDDRLLAGGGQLGARRAGAARRHGARHAAHPDARLARDPGRPEGGAS